MVRQFLHFENNIHMYHRSLKPEFMTGLLSRIFKLGLTITEHTHARTHAHSILYA